VINYRKNELEQKMLINLHKKSWNEGLKIGDSKAQSCENKRLTDVTYRIILQRVEIFISYDLEFAKAC
jgi:hypothetical protein